MLSMSIILIVFFITLVIAILSGLVFLIPSVPIKYIKIHLYLIVLPIIVSVIGLLNVSDREQIGPFTMDHLAWLMGSFILILDFIIQKFSVRYLIGDRNYRKYFPLFTLITSFASIAWLSGDLRLMVLFWGATLLSLTQFPFQSWLIESVAAPTPVSAIMHAGIVNAGGIILTRFSPVFNDPLAITILLIIASISVLLGSGISLVHVDYKRQLVGSTMSQMGFMLVQCALGVYSAAIIHLILHGVFKATLFLQSGSVVKRFNIPTPPSAKRSYSWVVLGRCLAIIIAILFWLGSDRSAYEILSALILAWSLMVSWNQMVAFSRGLIGRVIGIIMIVIVALVYIVTHHYFYNTLSHVYMNVAHPPLMSVIIGILILVFGSVLSIWVARQRDSKAFAVLYLWLVKLGEAKTKSIESHPTYLKKYL